MKRLPAILAALLITACLGLGMLAVGANALFNKNSVSVTQASTGMPASANAAGLSNQQLQELIAQYQAREQQYQQREQQYQDQLNQARKQLQQVSGQVQQFRDLIQELQARGLIVIDDGQIFIPGRFR